MKYQDRKKLMEELNPDQLNPTAKNPGVSEGYWRWYVLQLLADIADSQGSMAYAYQEMLRIQQKRKPGESKPQQPTERPDPMKPPVQQDIPPTTKSRYGGAK